MNSQPSPSTCERDHQALDWWTLPRSDRVPPRERNTFELWRLDPLNTNAYKNAEMLWRLLERPAHAPGCIRAA